MQKRLGQLLIALLLAFDSTAGATNRITMLRLTKARGYGRIVQNDIRLEAGKAYHFTCLIRGAFRMGQGDHVPEFRGPGPVEVTGPMAREAGGWTRLTRTVVPSKSGDHKLLMAIWNWNIFEITHIFLGDNPTGTNLVRNGSLGENLRHWSSDGGRLELSHLDRTQHFPVTMQGQPMTYHRFDGAKEKVLAYRGRNIVLLIPQGTAAASGTVNQIVGRLDHSWAYFRDLTGREALFSGDRLFLNGRGRITAMPLLSVVEQTCGAGCGLVGRAGIEIGVGIWDETYRNHVLNRETRGVFEYEMGRNFWYYDALLQSNDTPRYHLATAYATIYGHLAGVAGGSTTESGNENVDWIQSFRNAFSEYYKNPDFTNILNGGQPSAKILGGLWLHLGNVYGQEFHRKFFRAADTLRPAVDLKNALANFVIASSVASNCNLYDFFASDLKYPLPNDLRETLAKRFIEKPKPSNTTPSKSQSPTRPKPRATRHLLIRQSLPIRPLGRSTLRLNQRLQ